MEHSKLSETDSAPVSAPTSLTANSGSDKPLLILRMDEDFTILDAQGQPIYLTQKKGRLMLAMLGCSSNMRRSRDWLRSHLWGRSFTSHGYSSLRQCLHNLRRAMGPAGDCLQANREYIWLENTVVDWEPAMKDPSYFLAGLTQLEHSARQWLLQERAKLQDEDHEPLRETPARRDHIMPNVAR